MSILNSKVYNDQAYNQTALTSSTSTMSAVMLGSASVSATIKDTEIITDEAISFKGIFNSTTYNRVAYNQAIENPLEVLMQGSASVYAAGVTDANVILNMFVSSRTGEFNSRVYNILPLNGAYTPSMAGLSTVTASFIVVETISATFNGLSSVLGSSLQSALIYNGFNSGGYMGSPYNDALIPSTLIELANTVLLSATIVGQGIVAPIGVALNVVFIDLTLLQGTAAMNAHIFESAPFITETITLSITDTITHLQC